MKTKRKLLVTFVILLVLFIAALAIGFSGAFLFASRQSSGRLTMPKGIVIEYSGFVQEDNNNIWETTDATFKLFADTNAYPGKELVLSPVSIKPASNSIDFHARYKFEFKFYSDVNGENEISEINASKILIPSKQLSSAVWRENELYDGYYYYSPSGSLDLLTPSMTASSLFANGASFTIDPAFTGMGPGIEVEGGLTIMRIEIYLTLEVAQKGINWQMNRDPVVFNMDSTSTELIIQDENGDELSGEIVCDGSTLYQIVDKDGNGLQYTFSPADLPDADAVSEITSYVGDTIEHVTIPDYIVVNGQTYKTTRIGDFAFDSIEIGTLIIPDSVEEIGDGAFIDCDSIHTIYIGSGVKIIAGSAFMNTGIYNLYMGENVEEIGEAAFSGNFFRSIEIPASVKHIEV